MKENTEVINRLIKYWNALDKMRALGFVRVFSDNLADAIGVSPSLVRKDFSMFELTGHKRGGYQLQGLWERLNQILGKDEKQPVIVVGCGKVGRALMNYNGFARAGIHVMAGFDSDSERLDPAAPVPILHIRDMKRYIAECGVSVAVLTVPESFAQSTLDLLMDASIRGVINFVPLVLRGNDSCLIQNITIEQEFEKLFYRIRASEST